MAGVLLLLCAYYSWATLQRQQPTGQAAGDAVAKLATQTLSPSSNILIVAGESEEDHRFAAAAEDSFKHSGYQDVTRAEGDPPTIRKALEAFAQTNRPLAAIATTESLAARLEPIISKFPTISRAKIIVAPGYRWPTFLQSDNLINIANQIVVIAIIAVGMTLVIVTGGIDLSVGSLVALSAVVSGILIRDVAGGASAGWRGLLLCSLGGIFVSALVGAFSGSVIVLFRIPPFIATLGMMQVASGLAYEFSAGQSVYEIPSSFVWLGRGADFFSIPNAVLLMIVIYIVAHILMSRMRFGRYIYAVGGNPEAARLSGVSVGFVLLLVYTLCGAMAGLGGVIVTSQLKSASPTYGLSYELYVIAAVVVGGTSLSGGSGRIFGTLIGALIIAVIQNGMNLTGVRSYRQKIVLGLVILAAVLLDQLRRREWR